MNDPLQIKSDLGTLSIGGGPTFEARDIEVTFTPVTTADCRTAIREIESARLDPVNVRKALLIANIDVDWIDESKIKKLIRDLQSQD